MKQQHGIHSASKYLVNSYIESYLPWGKYVSCMTAHSAEGVHPSLQLLNGTCFSQLRRKLLKLNSNLSKLLNLLSCLFCFEFLFSHGHSRWQANLVDLGKIKYHWLNIIGQIQLVFRWKAGLGNLKNKLNESSDRTDLRMLLLLR